MTDMLRRLRSLDEPIAVAIIGAGSVGQGLFYQCSITPGMECIAICDSKVERAINAAKLVKRDYRVVGNPSDMRDAINTGILAVSEDGELLAKCAKADVLIEASSSIRHGGAYAVDAIESRTHVVMMNAEADLIFGPYLMELARKNGVVYTSCDGDQPGVIRRLIADVLLWGFEPVMAGNIKGFLDRYANPTSIAPEANKRGLDHRMCASYTDGSKLCVEMALLANAFDYRVDVPGMHGPRASHILDIPMLFDLERIYEERPGGVVDYVLGSEPKGGVFVVGFSDSRYQKRMLGWFPACLGDGPFYVFRRPYHLVHIEAMRCVAEAFLDGEALLQPKHGFKTNVFCYAKRDLERGNELDGFGGYTCYGLIENCEDDQESPGLPLCLAEGARIKRNLLKDQRIAMADVDYDSDRTEYRLYSLAMETSKTL